MQSDCVDEEVREADQPFQKLWDLKKANPRAYISGPLTAELLARLENRVQTVEEQGAS